MSLFRTSSISQRLYLMSIALILALSLVNINTWMSLNNVRNLTHRTGNVKVLQLSLIASTELKVTQALSDIRHAMLTNSPGGVEEAMRQVQLKRSQISKNDADFLAEITEQAGRDAFKKDWLDLQEASWPVAEKNLELIRQGENQAALKMLNDTTVPQFEKIQKWLSEERDRQTKYLSQDVATIGVSIEDVRLRLTLLVSAVAVSLMVVSLMITRALKARIAMAQGVANRVSEGDFSHGVSDDSKDEFSPLLNALSTMQTSLTSVVAQVRANAEGVATASSEIALGNQDLSQRTEEQASALEESSATMTQLGSTVRNNADSSKHANSLAQSASSVAVQGGEMVGKVIGAMQSISASSRTISDIIGVIDGIAFQTNILALNAAVEAARAGEQGRGFAVVAGEVRTLARRSADAAKEIKGLIGRSVEQVEMGSQLVAQTGETMTKIVNSIRQVSDIVGEITTASVEQTTAIQQVGDAVSQLDKVTQQNAALVEQSAAAAETLKGQAQSLVHAVSVFKLPGNGQDEAPAASQVVAANGVRRSSQHAPSTHRQTEDWASF